MKLTPAKCLANIIQNKITKEEYERNKRIAKQQNADMYVPYKTAMKYRDEHCLPPNIQILQNGKEIKCAVQDIANFSTNKLLKQWPEVKNNMVTIKKLEPRAKFVEIIKLGM